MVAVDDESIDVECGAAHFITNAHSHKLVIIEVQHDAQTGEDDIVRLDDGYGRHEPDARHCLTLVVGKIRLVS